MKQACVFIVLSIALLLSGCSGKGNPYIDPGWYSYATAHLPYVEEFVVPDVIYENETFEVTLKLSAQQDPEMLRGLTIQALVDFCNIPYPPVESGMRVGAWAWPEASPGGDEIVSELTFPLSGPQLNTPDGWPAGTYEVEVISAESPEWGGVTTQFQLTPILNRRPQSEHAVSRFYTITVLPKPEEEQEQE